MENILTKNISTTYIPGSAGVPGDPGQSWMPARYATEARTVCRFVATSASSDFVSNGNLGGSGASVYSGYTTPLYYEYICNTEQVQVYYPEQPYVAPTEAVDAVPSQVATDYNLGWNAGARSFPTLLGSGRAGFKAPLTTIGAVVGLNDVNVDAGYVNIDYAWYVTRGIARVYENGVEMAYSGEFADGDVFSIEKIRHEVRYKKNGTLVYTSTVPSHTALFLDASLYSGGDYVYDPYVTETMAIESTLEPLAAAGGDTAYANAEVSLSPLTVSSRPANRAAVSLSPLEAVASNRVYGEVSSAFEPLEVFAQGGMMLPAYAIGDAPLAYLTIGASGLTGGIGGSAASLSALDSLASHGTYGESVVSLQPLAVYGSAYEGNTKAAMLSVVGVAGEVTPYYEVAVVMTSTFDIVGVLALQTLVDEAVHGNLTLIDSHSLQALLNAAMNSVVLAGFGVPVFDGAHEVWVVNTDNMATSAYEQYDFNSFAKIGNQYYGCKQDGIYLLEGEDDDGLPIRASINYGSKDFGDSALKSITNCYVGVSSTGQMVLKVTANGEEYFYTARSADTNMRTQRIDVGKGLRANFFEFELFNQDGADFTLSNIEFAAAKLKRRI